MFIFSEKDYLYDWISCLYENRLYFGPFPNQMMSDQLVLEGFNVIVNLTMPNEEPIYVLPFYVHYYCLPIQDNSYPICHISYCKLISRLKMDFCSGKKIYIHCRGGHGRSSMTSVSLISNLFSYDLRRSIEYVNESHNQREVLRNKWRKRKSPFNYEQFIFLTKMHKNIYLNLNHPNKYYHWLLPSANEPVPYITGWCCPATRVYRNIYELCNDPNIFYDDKFCSMFSFLYKRLEPLSFKLKITYLKHFIVTDSNSPFFNELFNNVIRAIRDLYNLYIEYDFC